jgi:uncharacterized membrane protein YhaH (DUF805 family)
MFLLTHIIIALSSIVYAGYVLISPSKIKLWTAYGFVALTVATGTYVAITAHAQMLQTCMTGLTYLAIVFAAIAWAQRRLAAIEKTE